MQVQTYQYKTKSSKMMREFYAQTEKVGLHIDTRDDKPMAAKPYFTSEMWEAQREEHTLYIQCMVRGWFARRFILSSLFLTHLPEKQQL